MAGRRRRSEAGLVLSTIEGAAPAEMPGFIAPQLATLKAKPPAGEAWIHEIKFDGYRAQAHVSDAGTRVFTRKGLNWTKKFTAIAAEFASAGIGQAVVDGEIVVVVGERTDFGALQADLAAGRQDRLLFYAFDLLHLDGYDLRKVPQDAGEQQDRRPVEAERADDLVLREQVPVRRDVDQAERHHGGDEKAGEGDSQALGAGESRRRVRRRQDDLAGFVGNAGGEGGHR
jgi:hypothetical protein